ncbi:hypothetical protein GKE82_25285 [Conexibacter sp. W3-3-2]|uniref:hypothetical protein n=1 Tax=Conexibacter sp. W3-3-2 TaxID=2675227 RepID=UPI0012B703C4|nr:hypothetical protein [Conexibacter sp. W3-3-2]MTD47521.1 hypothetical protein [Conexibacter sp. W3-3-2]
MPDPILPVVFDDELLTPDLARLTDPARLALQIERRDAARLGGIPSSRLRRCRQDGPDRLPGCAKVYVPEGSTDRWALVLRLERRADGTHVLLAIAYGARHPTGTTASVYRIAHARLTRNDQ